jgi:hypothetical protein
MAMWRFKASLNVHLICSCVHLAAECFSHLQSSKYTERKYKRELQIVALACKLFTLSPLDLVFRAGLLDGVGDVTCELILQLGDLVLR